MLALRSQFVFPFLFISLLQSVVLPIDNPLSCSRSLLFAGVELGSLHICSFVCSFTRVGGVSANERVNGMFAEDKKSTSNCLLLIHPVTDNHYLFYLLRVFVEQDLADVNRRCSKTVRGSGAGQIVQVARSRTTSTASVALFHNQSCILELARCIFHISGFSFFALDATTTHPKKDCVGTHTHTRE